jgi:hypothetical protein
MGNLLYLVRNLISDWLVEGVHPDTDVKTMKGFWIILMALSPYPEDGKTVYTSGIKAVSDGLLFHRLEKFVWQALFKFEALRVNPIIQSVTYLHSDMIQLLLWQVR